MLHEQRASAHPMGNPMRHPTHTCTWKPAVTNKLKKLPHEAPHAHVRMEAGRSNEARTPCGNGVKEGCVCTCTSHARDERIAFATVLRHTRERVCGEMGGG